MNVKLVSVIINNYNYGRFIRECIDSVLKQTYADWELIIVDDGSKDESREIIMEYVNQYPDRITAVFQPNGGQGAACNAGYALSKGDIICFLDSDDYWYPEKLDIIVRAHDTHPLVAHNQDRAVSFGNTNIEIYDYRDQGQRLLREYGLVSWYDGVSTSAVSFDRGLINQLMPIPDEVKICMDVYLFIGAIYYSSMYYIREILSYYRVHEKNNFFRKENNDRMLKEVIAYSLEKINMKLVLEHKQPIPCLDRKMYRTMLEKEENFIIQPLKYVIYGASLGGRRVAEYIEYCGGTVYAFCDSKEEKWGTIFLDREVISPMQLIEKRKEYGKIVIGSMWIKEISEYLETLGLRAEADYIFSKIGFWN